MVKRRTHYEDSLFIQVNWLKAKKIQVQSKFGSEAEHWIGNTLGPPGQFRFF